MTAPLVVSLTGAWVATVFALARSRFARSKAVRVPRVGLADASGSPIAAPARSRRLVGLASLALVAAVVAGPSGLALVVAGALARARLGGLARRRRTVDELWSSAPDVVALLQLAITSGLTPYLAVIEVSTLVPRPFAPGFSLLADELRAGRRLGDALGRLLADQGEPVRPLVAALAAGDRYGVPVVPALDAAETELRRRRRQAADARARRLPVLLSFPLVCCILPAFVCLSIAPIAVSALRSLRVPASAVSPVSSFGSPATTTSPGGSP